jgi:hypothetical protein
LFIPRDAQVAVGGQHLGEGDAGDREHRGDLDAQPDEDEVARVAGHRPDRGAIREVQDQRVDDLVEPVEAPQREPREHDVPAAPLDLDRVDVDHDGEDEDGRPGEPAGIAQLVERLAAEVGERGGHGARHAIGRSVRLSCR